MSNPEYTERKFKTNGVRSDKLPRANIVRIESLDGDLRERYLGAVQRFGDRTRQKLYKTLNSSGDGLFFGFLTENATSFNMGMQWNDKDASGAILGGIKGIAKTVTKANALAGIGQLIEGASEIVGKTNNLFEKVGGLTSTTTGSGTVKEFSGVNLDNMTVKCGWYLPEQSQLCKRSLKALYRMAYPKQVDTEEVTKAFANMAKEGIDLAGDKINSYLGIGNNDTKKDDKNNENKNTETQAPAKDSAITNALKTVADFGGEAYNVYMNLQEAFGSNYTFNPLPVRLSVGHHIDVEPLVINRISTDFSAETFIDADGHHLPIFVNVQISFKYWLNPAPDLQFAKILDTELFGVRASNNGEAIKLTENKTTPIVVDNLTQAVNNLK